MLLVKSVILTYLTYIPPQSLNEYNIYIYLHLYSSILKYIPLGRVSCFYYCLTLPQTVLVLRGALDTSDIGGHN